MRHYSEENQHLAVRKERYYLGLALLVSLILLLSIQLPRILDPFVIERDYRSLGLFLPEPLSTELRSSIEVATPAYTLLMLTAGRFISPALFAKLLSIPLLLTSVYYVFGLGRRISGAGTALALALGFAVFNLGADTEVSVIAGLQRSFTCPLLLALLYYLHHKRWVVAAFIVGLTGTIYLPILPVSLLTYALSLVHRRTDGRWELLIKRRRIAPLLVAFAVVLVATAPVMVPRVVEAISSGVAALQSGEHLLNDPRHRPGGRGALFVIFPIFGRAGFVSSASTALQLIVLGLLALGVRLVRGDRARPLPPVLRRLFYASLIAFSLSWLAILITSSLLLYLPSRHTEFAFFLVLVFYVFLNLEETLNDLVRGIQRYRERLLWLAIPVLLVALGLSFSAQNAPPTNGSPQSLRWLLLLLAVVLVVLLGLFARRRTPSRARSEEVPPRSAPKMMWALLGGVLLLASPLYIRATGPAFHRPNDEQRALYAFLQTLPQDAVIAGSPCALDDVQFYAERRVLYSCWRFEEEKVLDGLQAYYADDEQEVANFCSQHEVDYLILDGETLDHALVESGGYFYEPYVTTLQPTLQNRSEFVLSQLPPEARLFERGNLSVVACDPATWTAQNAR